MRIFNFLPWRRRRNEQGLDRELQFHVERRVADLRRSGLDEGEARRQAVLELGGLTQVKEGVRDTWILFVESAIREFRHSVRMLRLAPAFSITTILTLVLGIGATTAMFSVVYGVVIKPLPYPESESIFQFDPDEPPAVYCCQGGIARLATAETLDGANAGVGRMLDSWVREENRPALLGIRLVAGRDLTWEELYEQRYVALVSESFAKTEWGSVDAAIGRRVLVGTGDMWQEVVGVVAEVHDNGADQEAPPIVYLPARLQPFVAGTFLPRSIVYTIRSDRTSTEDFVEDIRPTVTGAMPGLPVFQVRTMADVYVASMARTSFSLVLLGIAGAMALLLGIVGIYGALAYAVMQNQREVGIRLALGAAPRTVKGMFVYRGMLLSGVGIALGMAVAAGLTRMMASLLFGVTPLDALTCDVHYSLLFRSLAGATSRWPTRGIPCRSPFSASPWRARCFLGSRPWDSVSP